MVTGVWGIAGEQEEREIEKSQNEEENKKLRGKKIIKKENIDENKEKVNEKEAEEEKEEVQKEELNDSFNAFRNYLQAQGPMTVLSLARQFKIIDENGRKAYSSPFSLLDT